MSSRKYTASALYKLKGVGAQDSRALNSILNLSYNKPFNHRVSFIIGLQNLEMSQRH